MLLKFSVQNFRSFQDTVTLDLVSSTKIRSLDSHIHKYGSLKVLRNAVIYGANASGKSNLYRGLSLMQFTLQNGGLPLNCRDSYCKVSKGGRESDSSFDLMFEADGRFFDYGFSSRLANRRITSEWLYELRLPRKSPKTNGWIHNVIFARDETSGIRLGDDFNLDEDDRQRFGLYAADFAQTRDGLFLTELNRNKVFPLGSSLSVFNVVYRYLVERIRIIGAGEPQLQMGLFLNQDKLAQVSDLLASFDTGIDQLELKAVTPSEFKEMVPEPIVNDIKETLSALDARNAEDVGGVIRTPQSLIVINSHQSDELTVEKLSLKHGGSYFDYDFSEESDGTQRLFDFIELMFTADRNAVFVIDEIDQSLHPMLTRFLVEQFNRVHASDQCQLICTTHEDALMNTDLLRRDEIWFIEREPDGRSNLYSLDQFADVRSDTSLNHAYWEGRYGGIPVLSASWIERVAHASAQ